MNDTHIPHGVELQKNRFGDYTWQRAQPVDGPRHNQVTLMLQSPGGRAVLTVQCDA